MLEIKNLTKIYKGEKTAVENLSLTVHAGDIYGFIGHNGAGKTTTIKSIVGIHSFDQGEIAIVLTMLFAGLVFLGSMRMSRMDESQLTDVMKNIAVLLESQIQSLYPLHFGCQRQWYMDGEVFWHCFYLCPWEVFFSFWKSYSRSMEKFAVC